MRKIKRTLAFSTFFVLLYQIKNGKYSLFFTASQEKLKHGKNCPNLSHPSKLTVFIFDETRSVGKVIEIKKKVCQNKFEIEFCRVIREKYNDDLKFLLLFSCTRVYLWKVREKI